MEWVRYVGTYLEYFKEIYVITLEVTASYYSMNTYFTLHRHSKTLHRHLKDAKKTPRVKRIGIEVY